MPRESRLIIYLVSEADLSGQILPARVRPCTEITSRTLNEGYGASAMQ